MYRDTKDPTSDSRPKRVAIPRRLSPSPPIVERRASGPVPNKLASVLRDLKKRAVWLPVKEFTLPQSVYSSEALKLATQYVPPHAGSNSAMSRPPQKLRTEPKVSSIVRSIERSAVVDGSSKNQKNTTIQKLETTITPVEIGETKETAALGPEKEKKMEGTQQSMQRQAAITIDKSINKPAAHESVAAAATAAVASSTVQSTAAICYTPISIISLKPACTQLLPKPTTDVSVKTKKFSLESLVSKLNQARKEEDQDSGVSSSSSTSLTTVSPPPPDHPSSSISPPEGRTNKRKSNEPLRWVEYVETVEKPKRRGGKKKRGGKRAPPPKRRKIEETKGTTMNSGSINIIESTSIDAKWVDAEGLPPRIVVPGQEPGMELEWDEEEIIILRPGETPSQRPPMMKRKEKPEEAKEGDESLTMTAIEEGEVETEEFSVSPISLEDSSQASTADSSLDMSESTMPSISREQSASNAISPHTSTSIGAVLSSITSSISAPMEKRESLNSSSSSSFDSATNGRAKRAIKMRARYSPTPDEGTSLLRCSTQMSMEPSSSGTPLSI